MTTKTGLLTGMIVALACAAGLAVAEAEEVAPTEIWQEGTHYAEIPVPVDTETAGKIELVEMFSYACVHCYNFDPYLEAWRGGLPEDVAFRRIPAIFNDSWKLLAQVFYTAEVLGVGEELHMPLFRSIHEPDKTLDLRKPEFLEDLFADNAQVEPADFNNAFGSFSVRSRVQQADAHGRAYRISGVPTLIINGKYRVDGTMAGSNENMLKVAEYLLARERGAAMSDGAR